DGLAAEHLRIEATGALYVIRHDEVGQGDLIYGLAAFRHLVPPFDPYQAGLASPVGSSLAVDVVHRLAAAGFIGRGPGSAHLAPPARQAPGRDRRSTGSRALPDRR